MNVQTLIETGTWAPVPPCVVMLNAHRDGIIEAWFERARNRARAGQLPRERVIDNLPAIVDEIVNALSEPDPRAAVESIPLELAAAHGEHRQEMEYSLAELGEEYQSLRLAFLAALHSGGAEIPANISLALNAAVDRVHRAGVERYIELREHQLHQRQSEFLARITHDFRSPLVSVMLGVASVRRQLGHSATTRTEVVLDRIDRAARRLLLLVDAQLASEQALSGALRVTYREVDVGALVMDVTEVMRPRAEEKGLALNWSVPHGLRVRTDRLLLGQVLQNLLDNAVNYTGEGSVSVTALEEEGTLRLSVHDTGEGIPREALSRLFDLYRGGGDRPRGRGVGLCVVRSIVQALGGSIVAESEPSRGSVFTVAVPS